MWSLKEALEYIRNDFPIFSVKYVTHDRTRKKGGEVKFWGQVKALPTPKGKGSDHIINTEIFQEGRATGMRRKINIFLICEINGKTVYL